MLRQYCIDTTTSLISVLGRVQKLPFYPETLDPANDDACPYLAGGLNKRDGPDVREAGRVKNLGERREKTPLPDRATRAVFPEDTDVFIGGAKEGGRKGGKHIISATRGAWGRAGGRGTQGADIFVKGGGGTQRCLVLQEGGVGRKGALETSPENAEE